MTAEVAIMNQHALVFAADSATTVTSWSGGEKQVRFFKGANKLFQLSQTQPVGLMINGSASMHGVPWEIVVNEFRAQLGTDTCEKLSTYGDRFFNFVRSHQGLFPADVRREALTENAVVAVVAAVQELHKALGLESGAPSPPEADYVAVLTKHLEDARNEDAPKPLTRASIDAAVAAHADKLTADVLEHADTLELRHKSAASLAAELGIRLLMNRYSKYLDSTGIIIGGYGTEQFFPAFDVYECYGFLDGELLAVKQDDSCRIVNSSTDVAIEPFATTSMIHTFRTGIGPDVFATVVTATNRALHKFAVEIRDAIAPGVDIPDLDGRIASALTAHRDDWMKAGWRTHYLPLARVIASLPLPDMAALAKSLIELQSLKERVTEPTESVAGPIDVASISKHDGFVWIERKHYFRPELNPRFFARQSGTRA